VPRRAGSDPVVEDRILRSRRAKQGRPPDAETLEGTLTQEGVIAGTLPYMAPGTTAGQTGSRRETCGVRWNCQWLATEHPREAVARVARLRDWLLKVGVKLDRQICRRGL
jgi:hypothetical protein